MSRFARDSRSLQSVFPSTGREQARPSEVSDTVSLVHPFPSPAEGLERVRVETISGLASVTPVVSYPTGAVGIGQGLFESILFGSLESNSAVATFVATRLVVPGALSTPNLGVYAIANTFALPLVGAGGSAGGLGEAGIIICSPRSILIPPGCFFRAQHQGAAAAVAYTLTLQMVIVTRNLAEVPLTF